MHNPVHIWLVAPFVILVAAMMLGYFLFGYPDGIPD